MTTTDETRQLLQRIKCFLSALQTNMCKREVVLSDFLEFLHVKDSVDGQETLDREWGIRTGMRNDRRLVEDWISKLKRILNDKLDSESTTSTETSMNNQGKKSPPMTPKELDKIFRDLKLDMKQIKVRHWRKWNSYKNLMNASLSDPDLPNLAGKVFFAMERNGYDHTHAEELLKDLLARGLNEKQMGECEKRAKSQFGDIGYWWKTKKDDEDVSDEKDISDANIFDDVELGMS